MFNLYKISRIKTFYSALINFKNIYIYTLDAFNIGEKFKIRKLISRDNYNIYFRAKTIDRHIIAEIILRDSYNLEKFKNKNVNVIFDVGAQAGYFCVFAASKFPNAKIYSFEPEKENFNLLTKNIENNNFNICAYNFGLGANEYITNLFLSNINNGGHSIYPFEPTHLTQEIKIKSFNNVWEDLKIEKCDILKLDCEGSEYDIIYNLNPHKLKKISLIIGELHNLDNDKKNSEAFKNYLIENGFDVNITKYEMMGSNIHLFEAINKEFFIN